MRLIFLIIFFVFTVNAFSQIGGSSTYNFITLPSTARVTSLGGMCPSVRDNDFDLILENPSLLDSTMDKNLNLSYINYFSDINYGLVGYARHFRKVGVFSANLQYINYGNFKLTNTIGDELGNFNASEYALNITHSRNIDSLFSVGANFKILYSALYTYKSFGLGLDLGISYLSKNKLFSSGLVVKNIGRQLVSYTKNNNENLPFDIRIGFANKFKHAPLRILATIQHLEKFEISSINRNNPETHVDQETNEEVISKITIGEKILKHFIIGTEFIPSKSIRISFGYNFMRRDELKLSTKKGMTGITWGLGIKTSKFRIDYGRGSYHLAGASNHITIGTNLATFNKKIKK